MAITPIETTAAVIAIGKQSGLDSPAASPFMTLRHTSGGVRVETETYKQHHSDGQRAGAPLTGKTSIIGRGTISCQAGARELGYMLRAILGSDTVSGPDLDGIYTHTITDSNGISLYTIWEQVGTGSLARVVRHENCRIMRVRADLLPSTKGPIALEFDVVSLNPEKVVASIPAATATGSSTPYDFADLTGTVAIAGVNGGAGLANVDGLYFEVSDSSEARVPGDRVRAVAFMPGRIEANVAGSLIFDADAMELYNLIHYGTASPAVGDEPVAAQFSADVSATLAVGTGATLEQAAFTINSVNLETDAEVFANPDGGEILLPFSGVATDPTSILDLVVKRANDSAAY